MLFASSFRFLLVCSCSDHYYGVGHEYLYIKHKPGFAYTVSVKHVSCSSFCSWIKASLLALEQQPTDARRDDESSHPISLAGAVLRQVEGNHDKWDYR